MRIFSLFRPDDEPARNIEKELADLERGLADKREGLAHVEGELADLGTLQQEEHRGLIAGRNSLKDEIAWYEARIELVRKDVEAAEKRDATAARDARIAEAPAISKRANKRLVEIEKAARALAALLAEQAADQDAYSERERDARDAKRELPRLYADRDEPAVIEPERTVYDEKWMLKGHVNNGTIREPILAEYWTGCTHYHQDAKGNMVPSEAGAVLRKIPRVIPETVVRRARYFESPTATTVIAGHWPRA